MSYEDQAAAAAERARDHETLIALDNLDAITQESPTLREEFLTDDGTFCNWIGDAGFSVHDSETFRELRQMFESISEAQNADEYEKLGRFFYHLVMTEIVRASKSAE